MGIAGWQYKTSESGEWTDSRVTGLSYTIQNLQSNIWVRALVNDGAAPTPVSFSIVNGNGDPVPDGGTLTAKYTANGAEIQSDTGCTTYSSITFTYEEPTAYEVVTWKVNGNEVTTDRNGKTFTYTIDSLTTETTVNMVVRPKPTVAITSSTPPENCTFSVTYKLNGETVTPEEGKYVYSGTIATVTATPGNNYVATDVTAVWTKGEQTGSSGTSNTSKANGVQTVERVKISADTTFSATFVEKPKVTIETATGGTVTVKGTVNGTADTTLKTDDHVDFGTDLTVTLAPDKGYEVGNITGAQYTDGNGETTDNKSYTIRGVDKDKTITPVWSAIPTTTVNWSVIDKTPNTDGGTDGTLKATVTRKGMSNYAVTDSTAGILTVYRDSVVEFAAEPNTGYKTGVWQLNGKEQNSQPKLTITNNIAKLTITNDIVNTTQNVEVQFDPLGDQVTYGFQAGSADAAAHKAQLTAQFKPNVGTETNFASGTTPKTDGSITFTVSGLDNGYKVEGWYVDGSKQSGETGTTFTHKVTYNVGMDVQVKIVHKSYTVDFSATNGTVTAQANNAQLATGNSVVGDTEVTFKAKPQSATGYTFDGWTVNGAKREGTDETLTLNITEDTTVSAEYTLNTVSYAVNYGVTSENGTLTAKNGGKRSTPAQSSLPARPSSLRHSRRTVIRSRAGIRRLRVVVQFLIRLPSRTATPLPI